MALLGMLHKSLDQVTVTPLDTFGKKLVNFISGYGFVASRKTARASGISPSPTGKLEDQGAGVSEDALSVVTSDSGNSTSGSSGNGGGGGVTVLGDGGGSFSSSLSASASASASASGPGTGTTQRRRTAMSDFVARMRSNRAANRSNRLNVTNIRKNTRIGLRVLMGLAIALLPLAGDNLSPVGLVGTVAGLLTALVVFELWGGLRVNTLADVGHRSVSSGVAMMLVAAAALAPGALLSAHGHDHHGEHLPHVAHRHHHHAHGKASPDTASRRSMRGTLTSLFGGNSSNVGGGTSTVDRSSDTSLKADAIAAPAPTAGSAPTA
jgi:hypothetical protein